MEEERPLSDVEQWLIDRLAEDIRRRDDARRPKRGIMTDPTPVAITLDRSRFHEFGTTRVPRRPWLRG